MRELYLYLYWQYDDFDLSLMDVEQPPLGKKQEIPK